MKLFYSPNSPYARKCRVVLAEKSLVCEMVAVNALENPPELLAVNPLGTVPALVTDQGLHLCDSTAICEYLDTLPSAAPALLPEPKSRECVLAFVAMSDGIMDAAVACVLEGRRPKEIQYAMWRERKEAAIMRTIEKFSAIDMTHTPLSMGSIGLAVALSYVDFRLPHLDWRSKHPRLAAWLDDFSKRESMQATKPA
ncbi:MAG: glutathione S-transferase family protein [Rickettsiales bacterium]|jgi:glutathione S-transferase|nr:glutathione S-transferase family protein [Rickettsiales bacterium]